MEVTGQQPFPCGRGIRYAVDKRPCGLHSSYGRDGRNANTRPEICGLLTVYWLTGQFQHNDDGGGDDDDGDDDDGDDDDGDDDNSIVYYLRAGTTVTRPIIQPAQEHKEYTKIQKTNENTYKRGNKNHT